MKIETAHLPNGNIKFRVRHRGIIAETTLPPTIDRIAVNWHIKRLKQAVKQALIKNNFN